MIWCRFVRGDGKQIAAGVPVHVMTSSRDGARLELIVGDSTFPVVGLPNGHLRVVWPDYTGGYAKATTYGDMPEVAASCSFCLALP